MGRPALRGPRARSAALALVCALSVSGLPGCAWLGVAGDAHRPAWAQPPPPLKVGPIVAPGALTRVVLDNGLVVMVLEDRRLPIVSLGLSVRRGAGAVDPGQAGLAQFTAELMNRGAGERDSLALATAVDDIGASLAVSADWDSMNVSVAGLSRDLDRLVGILRDVVLAPRMAEDEAAKAQAEQLAQLDAARDEPGTLVMWYAMQALYPGHRYGRPIAGTPETVAKLDASFARALHAAYFVPNNAILYVSGDVDPADWLVRARDAFDAWQPGPLPSDTPATPIETPGARRVWIFDKPDLVQARILLAHEGIARTDERRVTANLVNDTLGGSGFSSRMMQTLRSEAGLTYSVGSGFALRRQAGPFAVSTFTRVAETRRAVDILLDELEGLTSTRMQTAEELDDAKAYDVGEFGLGLETSEAVMDSLVNLSIHGIPDDAIDTYRERVRDVTVEEARRVAVELIHPGRIGIVLLGPAADLAPQFESFGEVIVRYE